MDTRSGRYAGASPPTFHDQYEHRLAVVAWRRLDAHARWLDGLLECDWRTTQTAHRWERGDAILRAATG